MGVLEAGQEWKISTNYSHFQFCRSDVEGYEIDIQMILRLMILIKIIIPISFQVGHLEVEDSVFHKLKMESCPIEIPDSKVKHQDGVIYLK